MPGYNITLQQIVDNTYIKVIPGKNKKLNLRLGSDTGITNAEKLDDRLTCFIPEERSCQFLIMSTIIDAFDLKVNKLIIGCPDPPETFRLGEAEMKGLLNEAQKLSFDEKVVQEYCFVFNIPLPLVSPKVEYKTHFMIKGFPLTIRDIVSETNIDLYEKRNSKACIQLGENKGITNAESIRDNLLYVTVREGSDIEAMVDMIASTFKLQIVRIKMPIESPEK